MRLSMAVRRCAGQRNTGRGKRLVSLPPVRFISILTGAFAEVPVTGFLSYPGHFRLENRRRVLQDAPDIVPDGVGIAVVCTRVVHFHCRVQGRGRGQGYGEGSTWGFIVHGMLRAGGAGAGCEVDSLWHEYDVRRPADAAGDQQRSLVRQHSSFVSQRRRLLSTVPMPLRWRRR
jgi:hypothetical protein